MPGLAFISAGRPAKRIPITANHPHSRSRNTDVSLWATPESPSRPSEYLIIKNSLFEFSFLQKNGRILLDQVLGLPAPEQPDPGPEKAPPERHHWRLFIFSEKSLKIFMPAFVLIACPYRIQFSEKGEKK